MQLSSFGTTNPGHFCLLFVPVVEHTTLIFRCNIYTVYSESCPCFGTCSSYNPIHTHYTINICFTIYMITPQQTWAENSRTLALLVNRDKNAKNLGLSRSFQDPWQLWAGLPHIDTIIHFHAQSGQNHVIHVGTSTCNGSLQLSDRGLGLLLGSTYSTTPVRR